VAVGQPLRRVRTRPRPTLSYTNADFYQSDGAFDVDAAKDVYLDLLKLAGYPIPKRLRAEMFAKDWNTGRFTEIGLGGIFWINDKKWNYTSLEMFLLPNQMIPEHWHVGDDANGIPIKMESWHVRWGKTYTYGEGEPTEKLSVKVPDSQAKFVTALHETPLGVGDVGGLKKPLEKHWQQAAPSGCILTEPSTYHRDDLMRYTNPELS
jgi:D-lyxose ketol-isomerase